ncbi:MAG: methionyl-tRNA formyltransferase [Proteiniphilum sp.]|nr:methionyl-tRNA formyltransferase [Proteiniphilum sp.]
MEKNNLRILFMGTPEFAVESLRALVENGYNVVGVITMPDKPAGRGYKLQPSAVKQYAVQQGLKVLQPEKLKDEKFLAELQQMEVDLQVVVAFRMLPEVVWAMPTRGTFNLHASLLPQYRGAAPINWALINGEKETGVTTFFLSHEIDTGQIIFREKTAIEEGDNAGTLHDRLMEMGAKLVLKTVDAIINESLVPIPQQELISPDSLLKPAPKLHKETCRVNWDQTAVEVFNFIRGLSPYPTAWSEMRVDDGSEPLRFKWYASEVVADKNITLTPGTLVTDHKSFIHIATKDGFVRITDIQLSGKKRMETTEFLRGYTFPEKVIFS